MTVLWVLAVHVSCLQEAELQGSNKEWWQCSNICIVGLWQEVPLLAMPAMVNSVVLQTAGSKNETKGANYNSKIFEENSEKTWGMMSATDGYGFYSDTFARGFGRESEAQGGVFDGMALSNHFLRGYYGQVRSDFFLKQWKQDIQSKEGKVWLQIFWQQNQAL